jgi:hypothetical protein
MIIQATDYIKMVAGMGIIQLINILYVAHIYNYNVV